MLHQVSAYWGVHTCCIQGVHPEGFIHAAARRVCQGGGHPEGVSRGVHPCCCRGVYPGCTLPLTVCCSRGVYPGCTLPLTVCCSRGVYPGCTLPLTVDRMTDACENITALLRNAVGTNGLFSVVLSVNQILSIRKFHSSQLCNRTV